MSEEPRKTVDDMLADLAMDINERNKYDGDMQDAMRMAFQPAQPYKPPARKHALAAVYVELGTQSPNPLYNPSRQSTHEILTILVQELNEYIEVLVAEHSGDLPGLYATPVSLGKDIPVSNPHLADILSEMDAANIALKQTAQTLQRHGSNPQVTAIQQEVAAKLHALADKIQRFSAQPTYSDAIYIKKEFKFDDLPSGKFEPKEPKQKGN